MENSESQSNPFQPPVNRRADFMLNAVIANMHDLPKTGPVEDKEQAYELAYIQKADIEKALGHLATAQRRHDDYYCYVNGPRYMPAAAILQIIRGGRELKRAQAQIAKAYLAIQ